MLLERRTTEAEGFPWRTALGAHVADPYFRCHLPTVPRLVGHKPKTYFHVSAHSFVWRWLVYYTPHGIWKINWIWASADSSGRCLDRSLHDDCACHQGRRSCVHSVDLERLEDGQVLAEIYPKVTATGQRFHNRIREALGSLLPRRVVGQGMDRFHTPTHLNVRTILGRLLWCSFLNQWG